MNIKPCKIFRGVIKLWSRQSYYYVLTNFICKLTAENSYEIVKSILHSFNLLALNLLALNRVMPHRTRGPVSRVTRTRNVPVTLVEPCCNIPYL